VAARALREWKLVKDERAFQATEEIAMMLGDNAVVHYRLDKPMAARLAGRVAAQRGASSRDGDGRSA
jgi:hypothetical protein